jgi:hypothetical protein
MPYSSSCGLLLWCEIQKDLQHQYLSSYARDPDNEEDTLFVWDKVFSMSRHDTLWGRGQLPLNISLELGLVRFCLTGYIISKQDHSSTYDHT